MSNAKSLLGMYLAFAPLAIYLVCLMMYTTITGYVAIMFLVNSVLYYIWIYFYTQNVRLMLYQEIYDEVIDDLDNESDGSNE